MSNAFSVFEYLYRDASNYKAYGSVILRGSVSTDEKKRLLGYLNDGQWFIAEQVGLPPLFEELWKYSDGPNEDDFPFHEFADLRLARDEEIIDANVWGDVQDLLSNFEKLGNRWDIQRSGCDSYRN